MITLLFCLFVTMLGCLTILFSWLALIRLDKYLKELDEVKSRVESIERHLMRKTRYEPKHSSDTYSTN